VSILKFKDTVVSLLGLRLFAIAIQLTIILSATWLLAYPLSFHALLVVIIIELCFTCGSWYWHKYRSLNHPLGLFVQLLADILFLSLLLFYSGGATNAFVSLLLIPLALSAVLLTPVWVGVLTLVAVSAYSFMLWLMPLHIVHGNMQGHFVGMWINFLLSALVVALVVTQLSQTLSNREKALSRYREQQLKQEQMMSLALASAQLTHQLATPLTSLQLLAEELAEQYKNNELIESMNMQLQRCQQSVASFRSLAQNTSQNSNEPLVLSEFIKQLFEHISINHPDMTIEKQLEIDTQQERLIQSNAVLMPAILNLVNNAVRASKQQECYQIDIVIKQTQKHVAITLRDYGEGFSDVMLSELGSSPVESSQGLGMAVFLSHASLEKIGGTLTLANHPEQGAVVTLRLPLTNGYEQTNSD
jgi:two-component system sensor histidine kinase RegB